MDYDRIRNAILAVFAAILFAVVCHIAGRVQGRKIGRQQGYAEGYEAGYKAGYVAPHPSETIFKTGTLFFDRPVPVETKPAGVEMLPVGTLAQMQSRIDSLLAVKPDTAFVEVPVPIERVMYEDSTYRAQVSGWHPSLDWIEVYQRTQIITERIPDRRRWTFGVSAGPGVLYDGKGIHGGVGIVAGLQYRF